MKFFEQHKSIIGKILSIIGQGLLIIYVSSKHHEMDIIATMENKLLKSSSLLLFNGLMCSHT